MEILKLWKDIDDDRLRGWNQIMKILFFILSLSFAFISRGETPKSGEQCNFVISCPTDKMEFTVKIVSKSGDCTEDDSEILFKSAEKEAKLDLPPAWYHETGNVGSEKSSCKTGSYDEYPLFKINSHLALIFFRQDNRPSYDKVLVALLDYKKGKIVDQKVLGEIMRQSTGVIKTSKGYKLPVIKDYLKEIRCDCDAAFGEGWLNVSVTNGKLKTTWL